MKKRSSGTESTKNLTDDEFDEILSTWSDNNLPKIEDNPNDNQNDHQENESNEHQELLPERDLDQGSEVSAGGRMRVVSGWTLSDLGSPITDVTAYIPDKDTVKECLKKTKTREL